MTEQWSDRISAMRLRVASISNRATYLVRGARLNCLLWLESRATASSSISHQAFRTHAETSIVARSRAAKC